MASSRHRLLIVAMCLAMSGAVSTVLAQPPQGKGQGTPMYDTKTEAKLTGTVEAVENVTPPGRSGRRGLGGLHLTLKTATESIAVHLGPVAYLNDKHITVGKGDALDILGLRVTIDGETVLLAREVKKGDNTWTLRDQSGRPLWAGGRQ